MTYTDLKSKISKIVERKKHDYIDFLQKLIRLDTTHGREKIGQDLIISRLKRLPCEIDTFEPEPIRLKKYNEYNEGYSYNDRPNVVAHFKGQGNGKTLILNGHMDTVFPSTPEKWDINPWEPEIIDGKLYGLGSCDMKAGLVALLFAMEVIYELEVPLRGDVIFQSVVDEEASGGNGTLACVDKGYRADGVLVAEPTELKPMAAHIGSVAFRLTFSGMASHSNLKWEGVNSIEKSLPLLNALRELESNWKAQQSHPLLPKPILSINRIEAGTGPIIVPSTTVIEGNFTYLPGWENSVDEFVDVINSIIKQDEWLSENEPQLEWIHHVRPYCSDPKEDWPQAVEKSMKRYLNTDIKIAGFPTGTDARILANIGGMSTIILGPGSIRQAHTVNEFIDIEQFLSSIGLFAYIIVNWTNKERK